MTNSMQKIELLAPAGSLEAFFAAIESGADAVYCGLKEFSARAKAKNFSLAEVEKITAFAHGQNRRLYVALNTLIKENELPRLIDTLSDLNAIGVDGLIIQDMGLGRLAKKHFPGLKLHASTQMTIHNSGGVKMLERLGFTRAVLARELTIEEIAAIRSRTKIELEHFIHGALCFSISGLCLFSSFLNGASGNRGRCVQPCRRRYTCRDQTGYFLSTSDFCAIDLLPQLIEAGISSLKIEGRMKSAEYVARVVTAYRLVLDCTPAERRTTLAKAKEILKLAYGRQSTKGFLSGYVPTNLSLPDQQGSLGKLLGQITALKEKNILFSSALELNIGDRLRVLPKNDLDGVGFTVTKMLVGNRSVITAKAGTQVQVAVPGSAHFQKGDLVYKVRGEQLFTMSEEACRRKLAQIRPQPVAARLQLSCTSETLTIRGAARGIVVEQTYPVDTIVATNQPLSVETLTKVFSRAGESRFVLLDLSAAILAAVIIHPARLKEIRRDFYERLDLALNHSENERYEKQHHNALTSLLAAKPPAIDGNEPKLVVVAKDWHDIAIFKDQRLSQLILPLTPANVQACNRAGRQARQLAEQLAWDLPAMIFEAEFAEFRGVISRLCAQGFRSFRLNNLSHFVLFDGVTDARLYGGFRLYTTNSQAAVAWQELGGLAVTLSLEDDQENMSRLLSRELKIPAGITVYSPLPLIISRIPIRALPAEFRMQSDQGDGYRVTRQEGLTEVRSEAYFSLLGRLDELSNMGCTTFIVDLSHTGLAAKQGREVLDALLTNKPIAGTTVFNFDRGLR